ncbi:MAG: outer membrane protein [Hoeflea sp.]|uniref:outer membrane protein n=1 Tax=Hoeflea sp. TaxID=1940281 RepID=UPI0027320951|nr:outer membrane protein [Hoeflea sp.]MDP2122250.1 porin family protein [Hoeflea sp.]MDZ7603979.1 outer membrane protein [Hoeflea sp.]
MRKIFLAATAMVFAGVGSATAADVLPQIVEAPIYQTPISHPVASVGGWYLRGDVGYNWRQLKGAHYHTATGPANFRTASLDNGYSFGGGVGYQIRSYLRTDLTLDYLAKSDFTGSTGPGGPCTINGAFFAAPNCVSRDVSSWSALSLLANVYVDLGTYGRFTPYAGAGIGGSRVSWGTLKNTECVAGNPANCNTTSIDHGGKTEWRFTSALMLGTAIEINCKLKADLGYRYRRIEGGNMFAYNATVNSGPGFDKTLNIHEARAGLRYNLGSCAQDEVYIEPAPIMPAVYK